MNCDYCGAEETLPFVCNYCGGTYCAEHRLPESHRCTGDLSRRPVAQASTSAFSWSDGGAPAARRPVRTTFSRHEVGNILVAWLALGIAFTFAEFGGLLQGFSGGISVTIGNQVTKFNALDILGISLVTVGFGFVLHELMHKFVSERFGYRAEFRMWPQGLVLALVLSAFTGFVFAAPGATYIDGYGITKRENGIISLAGPLTNIVISLLFLPAYFLGIQLLNPYLFVAGILGSYINVFLAAFNMIPIMPLDGAKVFAWKKWLWAIVFIPLVILVFAYILGYTQIV